MTLIAEKLHLGYPISALAFGAVIAVIAFAHLGLRLNAVLAFWAAYIMTRPLGASLGDLLSQPRANGGLGLGTTATSAIFLVTILGLVTYLSITKKDVTASPNQDQDQGEDRDQDHADVPDPRADPAAPRVR